MSKRQHHHSVRDRSRGICPDCGTEQMLNPDDGRVSRHMVRIGKKRQVCTGTEHYPTIVTHDPDLAIGARAHIHESTLRKGTTLQPPKRKQTARPTPPVAPVLVTHVDPKVWRKAQALARRLGSGPVLIAFRVKESPK